MMRELFFVICIVHILCDFYLQPQTMADRKRKRKRKSLFWVFVHIFIYVISALYFLKIVFTGLPWGYCFLFVLSHALIDSLKYAICNSKIMKRKDIELSDTVIFVADQLLHMVIIGFIVYSVKDMMINQLYNKEIMNFFSVLQVQETLLVSWILKLLLIHKPSNIFISGILKKYRPKEKYMDADKNAGRFIGTLERIIMTILISINQYSAVGLVLTAKSIARYDKISKNQEFAEYYLLGTLLSTLCSIVIAVLV